MTEEQAPVEQTSLQQEKQQYDPTLDYEKRYKGTVKKIEDLTLENRRLNDLLSTMNSEKEQHGVQMSQKDIEKDVIKSEWERKFTEVFEQNKQYNSELSDLRALKIKIDVAKEIDPSLLPIIDKIPYSEDVEVLKTIMKDFSNFVDGRVKEREKQLSAGYTPTVTQSISQEQSVPQDSEGWQRYVNSFTPGTPEKEKAMNDWWEWQSRV